MAFYPNPIRGGLNKTSSLGDGYTINLQWFQGTPIVEGNKIAYNIYYSTIKENVFTEGIKYVSIDGSLEANIIDLIPGQLYFFCTRAVEYDPNIYNLATMLPVAYDNLRLIPSSLLRSDITATDTTIPLLDTFGYPNTGIINVGVELIHYTSVNYGTNDLYVDNGTAGGSYLIDQGDGYYSKSSGNDGYLVGLSLIDTNAKAENWKITCISVPPDGYGIFTATGSISGLSVDGYMNPIMWKSQGATISNDIFQFSITQNTAFSIGDYFTIKIGTVPSVESGRGYNNTTARMHTTDGYDGGLYWNPAVNFMILGEDTLQDRIFMCQSRFEYPNFQRTNADGYHQVTKDLLTTDLSSSDEYNEDFPAYDYAGYHRTDPVQLINGTCVGSYIGGEQGCIDKYGNVQMLRGFSLQDANNQRQELGLSVTGRPAVLIKRVRTGITCACYLPSSEYPDDRCPLCFAEGTLVRSEQGLIPIENINIGDRVLSADGYYYKVLQTFKTPFIGKLKAVTTTTTTNPILTTNDHPFLMLKSDHIVKNGCGPNSNCKEYIKRGDGQTLTKDIRQLPSGNWYARVKVKNHKRHTLGVFKTKEDGIAAIEEYKSIHSKPAHRLEWSEAKHINKTSWLVAKWNRSVIDLEKITIPQRFRKNTKLGSERIGSDEFIVDEEFLWIIGLYIAEGSNNKRSILFSLHQDEIEYQNKVVSFFKKYGFNPKLRSGKTKGVVVDVSSTSLAKWFPYLCGKLCNNKHIPEQFMSLPNNKLSAIILGIWDGDGTKRENEIIQTSEILCLQIAEILHRLGELPLITKINQTVTINGNKRKQAYRINWKGSTTTHINRKGRWQFYEQQLTKVKNVDEVDYDGYIYNLEVEGDHTYVVQNILVHNCYGTKFVFGYEQYFNPRRSDGRIMVRPGPADEDLKMTEAGLESEFILDFWTLTVPTIKDRDIIVLFDMDGNEEYRYEVLSVTRNNTALGLQGGQKFKAQRIRKFDPAYQVRIFRDSSMFPSQLNTSIGFTTSILPHTHKIVISEKIVSVNQINQTTDVVQGHNHPIVAGKILSAVGHSHTIILP
jgi:hypothetical protein